MIFADPPFNLNKDYGGNINDKLPDSEYIKWTFQWIDACIPLLSDGGALWVYNLPKWNIITGAHLMEDSRLTFRHQVAVNIQAPSRGVNEVINAHTKQAVPRALLAVVFH